MPVDRRTFLARGGAGTAAVTATAVLAAPAIAQSMPELRWRMASSFPKSLETIHRAAELFAKVVSEATDGRFVIQTFAAGEIVPGSQVSDAVSSGTVEMAHTCSYDYWGKDPAFAFGTAVPFGLNARMQNAWNYEGGAIDLLNAFYAKHQIFALPAGNTGTQMGGWYRREVNAPDDLKGLKIRFGGYGAAVLARLGALPQQMDGGDIYPALDKGIIDAAEWMGPHDDERLGLQKIAKYYYYPGWWEGGAMLHFFFNAEMWAGLPKAYQAIVRSAAALANTAMLARYDTLNPDALKKLYATGAELRPFPEPVLDACFKAAVEVSDEIATKNADFKKIYEHMKAFRADQYLWTQFADSRYDIYMMGQQQKKLI